MTQRPASPAARLHRGLRVGDCLPLFRASPALAQAREAHAWA